MLSFLAQKTRIKAVPVLFCWLAFSACVSHLELAKDFYSSGQVSAKVYKTQEALSNFKSARVEAARELQSRPSAQAYLVKGLAELNLEMWEEARASFLQAFAQGFEEGEDWAADVSLLGLAVAFEKFGNPDESFRLYSQLIKRSKLKPVLLPAAQGYLGGILRKSQGLEGREKERVLGDGRDSLDRLLERDYGCGFYHYLKSQLLGHAGALRESFDEAVAARELGLPSEKILRDNDLQLVFCLRALRRALTAEEWKSFESYGRRWTDRWDWKDLETPAWKEKE
jgi:tetratricopeptide (TPR) repeat protein